MDNRIKEAIRIKELEMAKNFFVSGYSYTAHHVPSGEDWLILGIDIKGDRVCAAGYPPSIGKLSDCVSFEMFGALDEEKLFYRKKLFGEGWL